MLSYVNTIIVYLQTFPFSSDCRDNLYRLSLKGLAKLEKASWPAPANLVELCQNKGQSEEACHNYIKVLLSNGKKLFACGTSAFAPACSWREVRSLFTSFIIFWNDFHFLLLWFSNPNIYLLTSTLFFLYSKSSTLIRNKHFYSFLILKKSFFKFLPTLFFFPKKKIDYYFCYVICTSTNLLYIPHCITEYVVRRSYNLYILSCYATYQYLHGIVIVVLI